MFRRERCVRPWAPLATGLLGGVLLSVSALVASCGTDRVAQSAPVEPWVDMPSHVPDAVVSGTCIEVALATELSSETAVVGDSWAGRLVKCVPLLHGGQIPAGSPVDGVVAIATPAGTGTEAVLQLGVRSITVNGQEEFIAARSESVRVGGPSHPRSGVDRWVRQADRHRRQERFGASANAGKWSAERRRGATRERVSLPDGTVLRFRVMQTVAMR